jgi:Fur family transcriptional regulator, ferric uptake regulator
MQMRTVRKMPLQRPTTPLHSGGMGAPRKRRDYEAVLRDAGLRITRPRRIILEILHATEGHPDATQIFERAVAMDSRISLATVYRTMRVLEESGAIQRHAFAGGPARFEEVQRGHHDHLIDLDTGEVIEFASPRIEALQEEIAARLGYSIVHHRLELYGRKIKVRD